jgi:transcriptional regulator with XRE-family HTH domain
MPSSSSRLCRLRELRVRSGLSQVQLAARSGLSLGTLRKLESGNKLATTRLGTLVAVARALGLAPTDVIPALRAAPVRPQDRTPRLRGEWTGGR